MGIEPLIAMLDGKDTAQAFTALKELEAIADKSALLYPYLDKFITMISAPEYVIRCRGFRLYCKQARWDNNNLMNNSITKALTILSDDKPTAVRQALAALHDVVLYKIELRAIIKAKVLAIDYLRYKETMHSLILKDIQSLLAMY